MEQPGVHRELLLPPPKSEPPKRTRVLFHSERPAWLEIERTRSGAVHYLFGAPSRLDLGNATLAIEGGFPRTQAGPPTNCALGARATIGGMFIRAQPQHRHNYWPLHFDAETDLAGALLRALASEATVHHQVVLQILFQRLAAWERRIFSTSYSAFIESLSPHQREKVEVRRSDPPYHVEIRGWITGPTPGWALRALQHWLGQWIAINGNPQWAWEVIPPKQVEAFLSAMRSHDPRAFASPPSARDVSSSELARLLCIPWKEHHPSLAYSGAPSSEAPHPLADVAGPFSTARRLLAAQPTVTPLGHPILHNPNVSLLNGPAKTRTLADVAWSPPTETRPSVGRTSGGVVRLPARWNHLGVLGRTQSGKSTLMLNLVFEILVRQPNASVVVIEPTGTLVTALVDRLGPRLSPDTIVIDPAHPTFSDDGEERATVPLNLLGAANQNPTSTLEAERVAERLTGDFLSAVRNAWGAESIGGRAEFVLRAVLQALLTVPGTNLVDAYQVLSDKAALRRLEDELPEGSLRTALRTHLPRLDYAFTISSLDKVGKIATNPLLRKALCQRYATVSFDQLLSHRLLLFDLSKGELGTEGANFLGALFVSQLWNAIQRSDNSDRPVYLIVDEFHNYAVPSFADMLSEGAKRGLHVIAVTQFLQRIPSMVRAAMLGNVDLWTVFSVGADDAEAVHRLLNGARYGWTPDDFVSGLRAHQAALATSDALVKFDTLPAISPMLAPEDVRGRVRQSMRRYAQPEDSESSPLSVDPKETVAVLRGLAGGPFQLAEIARRTRLHEPRLRAATCRCRAQGDVVSSTSGETLSLTDQGRVHLEALEGRRNEGGHHAELLARVGTFLHAAGIEMTIPRQRGGVLLPDGEFAWNGATYNVEVECSTLATHIEQVVRNVAKAAVAGRKCLVVVNTREDAERALEALSGTVNGARAGQEYAFVWPGSTGLVPYGEVEPGKWGFLLPARVRPSGFDQTVAFPEAPRPVIRPAFTDSDLTLVARIHEELLSEGSGTAAYTDFLARFPESERSGWTERRLGVALDMLGVSGRRVQKDGVRHRVYDLASHRPARASNPPRSPPLP